MKQIIIVTKNYKTGFISASITVQGIKWSSSTRMRICAGHLLNKLNGHKFSWKLYEDGALGGLNYYPVESSNRIMIYKINEPSPVYAIVPAVLDLNMLDAVDTMVKRKGGIE